jgi:hypothetical protein
MMLRVRADATRVASLVHCAAGMAPEKTTKDLPAPRTVKGGKVALNDNLTLVRAAKPAKKDLPAKKTVKGGKVALNNNLTLVRGV